MYHAIGQFDPVTLSLLRNETGFFFLATLTDLVLKHARLSKSDPATLLLFLNVTKAVIVAQFTVWASVCF